MICEKEKWSPTRRKPQVIASNQHFVDMSEYDLVLACQRREEGALEQLFRRHQRTIKVILYRLAPDFTDTSDIVQDVFIRMWESIGQLKNPNAFKSWLNQMVTRMVYDVLRRRTNSYSLISLDSPLIGANGSDYIVREIVDSSPKPDERILGKELYNELATAVSSVPEQFRIVLLLRDVEGLSYQEIALVTDTELGTVKSRLARARRKVQERIVPYINSAA